MKRKRTDVSGAVVKAAIDNGTFWLSAIEMLDVDADAADAIRALVSRESAAALRSGFAARVPDQMLKARVWQSAIPDDAWAYLIAQFTDRQAALDFAVTEAARWQRKMLVLPSNPRGRIEEWFVYPANHEGLGIEYGLRAERDRRRDAER